MTLLQDLRYAARLLIRDPWFTLVAATALGLGIGLNTTVFTFVNAVLIRGLPFDRPGELLYLTSRTLTDGDDRGSSYLDLSDWRGQTKTFQGLAALEPSTMNVSEAGRPAERVTGAFVSANTFGLLRQAPILGREFAAREDTPEAAPVVILGYSVWKNRYGGDPGVLGRTIRVNDVASTIIGVMPEGMRFPTNADMWRPLVPQKDRLTKRDNRSLGVFGRLSPGATRATAQTEMTGIAARLAQQYPDTNKDIGVALMTFNERFNGGRIRSVFLALMGAVGFVLLIACANVANLLLARSTRRTREIAVRVALGAGRGRVIRQLLVESTLLACIGGVLGLGLSWFGIRAFDAAVAEVGKPYWIRFTMDYTVFGFMALVCLVTGILFGMAPALQVSKTNVNEVLKEGGRGSSGSVRARRLTSAMVVVELTLTLVLLTGAGLMVRSFMNLYSLELGVDTGHVLTMRTLLSEERYPTPETRQQFFDSLGTALEAVPSVAAASTTTSLPMQGSESRVLEIEGRATPDAKTGPQCSMIWVGSHYFDVFRIPLARGRLLKLDDGTPGHETIVVNERFVARFFNGEDPLGRRVRPLTEPNATTPNPWLTIVGVVPTVRQNDPRESDDTSLIYVSSRQRPQRATNIVVRALGDPGQLTAAVRGAVQAIDIDQPVFNVKTMKELLMESQWPYRVFGTMFGVFALVALVLSAVGIYAVTAYAVTQRTPEIGVRMALGARSAQVSWLILKTGLVQLTIGVTLGLLGAWGVTSVLQSIMVQISPTDPVTFTAVTAILSLVTIAACLVPARRAMRLDPVKALNRT